MNMNAVVLGVDPGSCSGGAVLDPRGRRVASAQIEQTNAAARTSIVTCAIDLALDLGVDLVVVREKWQAGGRMNPATSAGLGAAWGLWLEQLHICAPYLPGSRIHSVYPATWRSRVLGAGAKASDDWAKLASTYVFGRFGLTDPGLDERVALCIACWAFVDAKVRKTVQDRPRWHAQAREHRDAMGSPAVLRAALESAQRRIRELERALANDAVERLPQLDNEEDT